MKQVFEYVQSFVVIALVLAGLGGVSYHMFREGGWLSTALGTVWNIQMANPIIAIPVTIAIVVLGKLWYDRKRAKGYTSRLPDAVIYVIMAAGVYFIWQFFAEGTA